MAHDAIKGHKDAQCLRLPPLAMKLSKSCATTEATLIWCCSRLPRIISGFVVLQQPDSESTSLAPVATKDYVVAWSLIGHLRPCCNTRAMLHLAESKWNVLLSGAIMISGPEMQLGHLWVHTPTAIRFCVDVHASS